MGKVRFLLALASACALAACARHQATTYIIDPATGQPVPVIAQRPYSQPQPQPGYAEPRAAQAYAQPPASQQPYAQPQSSSGGRGLFNSRQSAPQAYARQPSAQRSYVLQYSPPPQSPPQYTPPPQYASPTQYAAPTRPVVPQYAVPAPQGGPYAAAPYAYAYAPAEQPYTLDSGDRLRIVVFGQEGISNSYIVDAGGNVNLPLVGVIQARGVTTQQLAKIISERLKQGYVREPHVSVEVETYRPFFILGEVTTPGQYPYVANMTAENAVAIAGGFAPRAEKKTVKLTRSTPQQQFTGEVPLSYPLRPGDTIVVKERWF